MMQTGGQELTSAKDANSRLETLGPDSTVWRGLLQELPNLLAAVCGCRQFVPANHSVTFLILTALMVVQEKKANPQEVPPTFSCRKRETRRKRNCFRNASIESLTQQSAPPLRSSLIYGQPAEPNRRSFVMATAQARRSIFLAGLLNLGLWWRV
jgi:hypothetical protein